MSDKPSERSPEKRWAPEWDAPPKWPGDDFYERFGRDLLDPISRKQEWFLFVSAFFGALALVLAIVPSELVSGGWWWRPGVIWAGSAFFAFAAAWVVLSLETIAARLLFIAHMLKIIATLLQDIRDKRRRLVGGEEE